MSIRRSEKGEHYAGFLIAKEAKITVCVKARTRRVGGITKNGFDPQSLAVVAVMTLWSAFHSCETIARTINFSLRK